MPRNSGDGEMGCLLFLLIIGGVIWLADISFPFKHEIASYPLGCNKPYIDGECPGYEYPQNPTTYKINKARNEVVGKAAGVIFTLVNCDIWDRENWQCSYKDNSGKVKFKDGIEQIQPNEKADTRYVSRWKYYFVKFWRLLS